jgi:hypothetical protein
MVPSSSQPALAILLRAFLVPKKFGGWRLCVDLRYINEHVRKYVCRFESLKALQSLAKKGYYMVSFDLQDAYQVCQHCGSRSEVSLLLCGWGVFCLHCPAFRLH